MRIYKKQGRRYYQVEWRTWDGKRRYASTRTEDRRVAKKRAVDIIRAAENRAPSYPLEEALNRLGRHKARMGQSQRTMEIFAVKSGHLLRLFGQGLDVCTLTLEDTEAYLDRRREEGASNRTIEMELGTLRAALRRGKELDKYHGDPKSLWPAALRGAYDPRGRAHRWLTPEQLRELCMAASPTRRDHLVVYAGTGVRYSELYRLEARDLDRDGCRVRVRGTKTASSDRWVHPQADAWDALVKRAQKYPRGPLFPDVWLRSNLCQDLQRALARTTLPFDKISANDLRRSFASMCLNHGVREDVCVRWMGHSSTQMVRQVYAQLGAEEGAAQASRLPRIMGCDSAPGTGGKTGHLRSVMAAKPGGK